MWVLIDACSVPHSQQHNASHIPPAPASQPSLGGGGSQKGAYNKKGAQPDSAVCGGGKKQNSKSKTGRSAEKVTKTFIHGKSNTGRRRINSEASRNNIQITTPYLNVLNITTHL